jgi:hypothetical protein
LVNLNVKDGDTIRVVAAERDDFIYKNGDIFDVGTVWDDKRGVNTTAGIELWAYEFEVISRH